MVSAPRDSELAEAKRKVREEYERFRAALPGLLEDPALRDRFVVFMDGVVVAVLDDIDAALADGERRFGELGGFVVARVEPERVHRIGGGFRTPRADEG